MILDRVFNLGSRPQLSQTLRGRRYEGAKTSRLNSAHWKDAEDRPINRDLSEDLNTLCARIACECQNNALVEGVIDTHVTDIVGPNGPKLQVLTSDKKYARELEPIYEDFWSMPDLKGQWSGVDFLANDIQMTWRRGEYLTQIASDPSARTLIKLRLQQIHPRRLNTPFARAADSAITLGVERTPVGRPIRYWIQDPNDGEFGFATFDNFTDIPAEFIIHSPNVVEDGQARGVPLLASALQAIADLRDYGVQTLDAARQAADFAALLVATGPDVETAKVSGSATIERRMISMAPPGWDLKQLKPEQPSTTYVQYVRERLRELGRPVSMPLLIILCDASNHNYSSARFDGQKYQKGVRRYQASLERVKLNRLVRLVEREAFLAGKLSARPRDVRLNWIWPGEPHVDPKKEAEAEDIELSNGVKTFADACAMRGKDPDQQREQLAREVDEFKKVGLTHPFMQDTKRVKGGVALANDEEQEREDALPTAIAQRVGLHNGSPH